MNRWRISEGLLAVLSLRLTPFWVRPEHRFLYVASYIVRFSSPIAWCVGSVYWCRGVSGSPAAPVGPKTKRTHGRTTREPDRARSSAQQ